jgi:hypothetical protein
MFFPRTIICFFVLAFAATSWAAGVSATCHADLVRAAASNPSAFGGLATDVTKDIAKRKADALAAKAKCFFGCKDQPATPTWPDGLVKGACFGELSLMAESNPTAMKDVLAQVSKDAAKQKATDAALGAVGSVSPGAASLAAGALATQGFTGSQGTAASPATPTQPASFGDAIRQGAALTDTAAIREAFKNAFYPLLKKDATASEYQARIDTIGAYRWAQTPNTDTLFTRSVAVLQDYISAIENTPITIRASLAKVILGAYDPQTGTFPFEVYDTASVTAPFDFVGTVSADSSLSATDLRSSVEFQNYPFQSKAGQVYFIPLKISVSRNGQPLTVEGSFRAIDRYGAEDGYASWYGHMDSLWQGHLTAKGLPSAYALGENFQPTVTPVVQAQPVVQAAAMIATATTAPTVPAVPTVQPQTPQPIATDWAQSAVASATESQPASSQGLGIVPRVALFVLAAAGTGFSIYHMTEIGDQEDNFREAENRFSSNRSLKNYQAMADAKREADVSTIYRNVGLSFSLLCLAGGIFF